MINIPNENNEIELYFQRANILLKRRSKYRKWNARLIKVLPINSIPGYKQAMKDFRDYLLNIDYYGKSDMYYVVTGPLNVRHKTTFGFNLFEKLIEVNCENNKFYSIERFDDFLRVVYNNYMQLPPEDQRHPYHGGKYYWK